MLRACHLAVTLCIQIRVIWRRGLNTQHHQISGAHQSRDKVEGRGRGAEAIISPRPPHSTLLDYTIKIEIHF